MEKALHCQVGFAYMMRIIACLKFDASFGGKKGPSFFFIGWQIKFKKKCVTKNNLPTPPSLPLHWWSSFRFSPMVFLYLSTVIPSIWFLELSLLQSKLPVNNSSGPELHLLAHIPITAVGVPPQNCPPHHNLHAATLKQHLI